MAQFFASVNLIPPLRVNLPAFRLVEGCALKKINTIIKIIIINRRSVYAVDEEVDCSPQKVALKYWVSSWTFFLEYK